MPYFKGFARFAQLFPLYGGNRLICHVPKNTVYTRYFRNHSVTNRAKGIPGKNDSFCCNGIHRIDGTNDDGPSHIALTILNSGGLHVRDDGKILPRCFFHLADLFSYDGIRLAKSVQPVTCDCTDTANSETRSGEGLTINHVIREAKSFSNYAHFIFVQKFDRLNEFELKSFGKSTDVVVGFYFPIIFLFCSGSVTPASLSRKRSTAST